MELKKSAKGNAPEYTIRDENGFVLAVIQLVETEGYRGIHVAHSERVNVLKDRTENPEDWF